MSTIGIAESDIETFERDGVVCLRGAFDAEWMARIERGIESELATPGPRFLDQQDAGQPGRFGLLTHDALKELIETALLPTTANVV